jgi:hypothetical protein
MVYLIFFTAFNSVSSRSHLFIIFKNNKLNNELALIDLAGNEPNWKSSTVQGMNVSASIRSNSSSKAIGGQQTSNRRSKKTK